jgi:hypothetical protein
MKNINQILKGLSRKGFRLEFARGGSSTVKIYPPNPAQSFYSFHVGESGLHPLRRFAKHNWMLDINNL